MHHLLAEICFVVFALFGFRGVEAVGVGVSVGNERGEQRSAKVTDYNVVDLLAFIPAIILCGSADCQILRSSGNSGEP